MTEADAAGADIPISPPNPKRRTSIARNIFEAMRTLMPASSTSRNSSAAALPPMRSTIPAAAGLGSATTNESVRSAGSTSKPRLSHRLSLYKRRSLEKESASNAGSNRTNNTDAGGDESFASTSYNEPTSPTGSTAVVSFVEGTETISPKRSSQGMMKKRQSSRRFLGLSRDKSQKFEITEDMINLQRIICDKPHRQKLIELLIPLDGDSSVKVRFCAAVEEYQREKEKKEKNRKGAQIVKMFIKKGSLFRLKGIPPE